ncbi:MAG: response regulator transcription factor [Chloroflexaceae bacterium]|nr:response regulator transcription factor [Chloroflexaceae bacterium]
MNNPSSIRILLADDEPALCSALRLLLEQEPGLTVVGEATGASSAQQQAATVHPDLMLLDWELPGSIGVSLLHSLRGIASEMQIIVLSSRPEARRAALVAGADAFVSKGDPPDCLLATIRGLFPHCTIDTA